MRRPAGVVAAAAATLIVASITACGVTSGARTNEVPVPAPPTRSTAAVLIDVPNVIGQNAAVAQQQLAAEGFTDIRFSPVDGHEFVALPENWSVKTQSAQPGTRLRPATIIVLGCAKN